MPAGTLSSNPTAPDVATFLVDLDAWRRGVGQQDLEREVRALIAPLVEQLQRYNPAGFARAQRFHALGSWILVRAGRPDRWQAPLAALLSQVGTIELPTALVARVDRGEAPTPAEAASLRELPELSARLLAVHRGEAEIATIRTAIRNQDAAATIDAQLIVVVRDYDALRASGFEPADAVATMRSRDDAYDRSLLAALERLVSGRDEPSDPAVAPADELKVGMVLAADLYTALGTKLLQEGSEITPERLDRIRSYEELDGGLAEPVLVLSTDTGVAA